MDERALLLAVGLGGPAGQLQALLQTAVGGGLGVPGRGLSAPQPPPGLRPLFHPAPEASNQLSQASIDLLNQLLVGQGAFAPPPQGGAALPVALPMAPAGALPMPPLPANFDQLDRPDSRGRARSGDTRSSNQNYATRHQQVGAGASQDGSWDTGNGCGGDGYACGSAASFIFRVLCCTCGCWAALQAEARRRSRINQRWAASLYAPSHL